MSDTLTETAPGSAAGALADLAADHWQAYLASHPYEATVIGERRFDALLEDESPEGTEARLGAIAGFRARAVSIDPEALSEADRLTRSVLIEALDAEAARLKSGLHEWTVDPVQGPHILFMGLPPLQPVSTVAEGQDFIRRVGAMADFLDVHMANLRRSLARGTVAVHEPVVKTIGTLDGMATTPLESWAILDRSARRMDWAAPTSRTSVPTCWPSSASACRPRSGAIGTCWSRRSCPLHGRTTSPGSCTSPAVPRPTGC
jgi:uncharacterized protein (DUF885 family)